MINTLKKLFRRINCRHESQKFIRNIYGSEILYTDSRSIWKCDRCGKTIYKPDLCKNPGGWSLFDFFASEHDMHLTESQLDDITAAACSRENFSYYSTQKTRCARCNILKHTPIRNDAMGGYVCLTCIDKELIRLQMLEEHHPDGPQLNCPHCNSGLLWSEDRGAHCDGCDKFNPETDVPAGGVK